MQERSRRRAANERGQRDSQRAARLELMGLLSGHWLARIYDPARDGELTAAERRARAERWAARHLEAELWRVQRGLRPSFVDRRLLSVALRHAVL